MEKIKIAVGYVRCSTTMQDKSINQQKREIDNWAKERFFKIIEWFEDEGESGTSFEKRPAFQRLLRRVESSPNFEYVLVYDEARWGRAGDPRESTYWKFHFGKKHVIVRIINSQSKNENDVGSYVIEVVEGAEASEYSKKLSRSTLRGCRDNASKGYSNGGTPPYGYCRLAVSKETGKVVRELKSAEWAISSQEKVTWGLGDEREVQTVKRIFELKIGGYGYRAIADTLNKENIPCPKRGRWRNKDQKWSVGTIQSIITNPNYYGDRVYNRHPLSKKRKGEMNVLGQSKERWISDENEWVVGKGAHEPIISKEIFEKANGARTNAKPSNQFDYRSPYLLSRLVKCERCGFNFQGQSYRKENKYYYVDGGNMNKGNSVCGRTSIRKELLEGYILGFIRESIPKSRTLHRFEEMIGEYLEKNTRSNHEAELIGKRLMDNENRTKRVLDLLDGGVSQDTILGKLRELEAEKRTLEQDRLKVERISARSVDVKSASQEAINYLSKFEKRFETLPIEEQKQMIRRVVLGVSVNPETRIARIAITKIPMVTPALQALINPSEFMKIEHPVGAHCSGGRT